MKKNTLLICFILFSFCAYTQELSGIIKYRIMYNYAIETHPDAIVMGTPNTEFDLPGYLYFNAQKSLFVYDKEAYKSEEALPDYKRKRDKHGQIYFIDKSLGELYIREFIYARPYITHEPIPKIAWQLKNEVKTISGYVCKKATAEFRGRKYTAWYTSAIPVSVGPWKLQGLPGAILEAETEDKEVKFKVESIKIPADVQNEFNNKEIPDGKIVSFKEYLEAFEIERKKIEESTFNMMMNFFEEEKKKGNIKEIPQAKGGINKMFRIEKYE